MQGMHQKSIGLYQISNSYSYHLIFQLCASINQPLNVIVLFGSRESLFILFLYFHPHLI